MNDHDNSGIIIIEKDNDFPQPPAEMQGPVCPVPLAHRDRILLGHGSGGKMSHDLIANIFLPPFDNPSLRAGNDAGVVETPSGIRLAISTDSHVVWPLFFPGGDIGRLAVCGTVNDVAMMGARPLYLTAGFILEEGLDVNILDRVVTSMKLAAEEAGVMIIAGDTKVVQKGKADLMYINTTGVGVLPKDITINGARAQPGDVVILSGTLGDHGIAVLSARGDLGFEVEVESDVTPLNHLVMAIMEALSDSGEADEKDQRHDIHVMRDPTRGGLATSLNEIARQSEVGIQLFEDKIPINPPVAASCEMFGFDPLYVANEGKMIVICSHQVADRVLAVMQTSPYGKNATVIGEVSSEPQGRVLMKTTIGSTRVVDLLSGELLPRIC